jgi:hypothetical protein
MRLSGWWRLWILLSGLWFVAVGAFGYSWWPSEPEAAHHPAFLYQLDLEQRALLSAEGESGANVAIMPNGHRLRFKPEVGEDDMSAVAQAYSDITVKAQADARLEFLVRLSLIGFLPPLATALLGLGVAWVRRGFADGAKRSL